MDIPMKRMSAHDAKARFGQLLDMARDEPVVIEKHGKGVAVVLSKEEFESVRELKIQSLRTEIQKGLDDLESGRAVSVDDATLQAFADTIKQRARSLK